MSEAYVDTSCLLSPLFNEPFGPETRAILEEYDNLVSSNLLEAEVRSALIREGVDAEPTFLAEIGWLFPTRPLTREMSRALSAGYLRGADLWHLATALYVADDPADLPFLTFDSRQHDVAAALGFPTPLGPITP